MEINFAGKNVLVTGVGQGIGRAIAKELVKCKANVFGISLSQEQLDDLNVKEPTIKTFQVDLNNWEETRKVVRQIGPIDCLVNNAAIAKLSAFLDVTPEEIDISYSLNVKSIINVSQVVVEGMIARKSGGSIVNISSQASKAALKDHTVYCGTKGAVDLTTQVMALELGPHNIRVNTVNPTVVLTAMGRLGWSEPQKAEEMLSKIPLRRFAEVEEVVNAVLFLLSDKASMINGVALPIDGGFLAC